MKRWMMWTAILLVLGGVLVAGAQTNRHGGSGGTVKELPEPRKSTEQGSVEIFEQTNAVITPDPELKQVEASFQEQTLKIAAELEANPSREKRRALEAESHLLKMQFEKQVLELLQQRAVNRNDQPNLAEIRLQLEHIENQIILAEARHSRFLANSSKSAARDNTARDFRGNGDQSSAERSSGGDR